MNRPNPPTILDTLRRIHAETALAYLSAVCKMLSGDYRLTEGEKYAIAVHRAVNELIDSIPELAARKRVLERGDR